MVFSLFLFSTQQTNVPSSTVEGGINTNVNKAQPSPDIHRTAACGGQWIATFPAMNLFWEEVDQCHKSRRCAMFPDILFQMP